MALNRLFNPKVHPDETNVEDAREPQDRFMNVPVHAEVPRFWGPTDTGQPQYPLKMSSESQAKSLNMKRRVFVTNNGKIDY